MMMSMSKTAILKALVNERLMVAAEEIFGLFERALVDYDEERLEIKRQHNNNNKLLLAAGGRANALLPVSDKDVVPEQQCCMLERTSCVDQKDPRPPQIKEEQEELWSGRAGEQLQESGNVHGHAQDSMFNIIYAQSIKSDIDEDGTQSPPTCQSEENAECDPAPSTSTDQVKTEPDEEGSDRLSSLHRSVVESEDSGGDEEWRNKTSLKTKKPQQQADLVEKPYSCSVCIKSFGHKHVLSRHMMSHTGQKPYSCDICGKRFIQRSYLQTHIISHSGMQYLQKNADTAVLEHGLKNKWRWQWLEETDPQGQRYDVWLAKVDIPGMAWCKLCNKNSVYRQNGKKVFARHAEDNHRKGMLNQTLQHTLTLPNVP